MRQLYRSAFPLNERKPLPLLTAQVRQGCAEFLAIRGNGRFLGMMIPVRYHDIVLLDYFAVSPAVRGKGVGSRALQLFIERYANSRIILEIEHPKRDASNNAQRLRRKAFYLQNGMRDSALRIRLYQTEMELLCANAPVAFEEYCALLKATLGGVFYAILQPRKLSSDAPTPNEI